MKQYKIVIVAEPVKNNKLSFFNQSLSLVPKMQTIYQISSYRKVERTVRVFHLQLLYQMERRDTLSVFHFNRVNLDRETTRKKILNSFLYHGESFTWVSQARFIGSQTTRHDPDLLEIQSINRLSSDLTLALCFITLT